MAATTSIARLYRKRKCDGQDNSQRLSRCILDSTSTSGHLEKSMENVPTSPPNIQPTFDCQAIIERVETMFTNRELLREQLVETEAELARVSIYTKQLDQQHANCARRLRDQKTQQIRTLSDFNHSISWKRTVTVYTLIKTTHLPSEIIQMIGNYVSFEIINMSFRFRYNRELCVYMDTHRFKAFDTDWEFSLPQDNEMECKPLLVQFGSTKQILDWSTSMRIQDASPTRFFSMNVVNDSVHYISRPNEQYIKPANGSDLIVHLKLEPNWINIH